MSDDEIRAPDNVFKETLINSSKEFLENTNYNEDFELNKAIQESILEVEDEEYFNDQLDFLNTTIEDEQLKLFEDEQIRLFEEEQIELLKKKIEEDEKEKENIIIKKSIRHTSLESLCVNLLKIKKKDPNLNDFFFLLDFIINDYNDCNIDNFYVDELTYTNILNELSKIRVKDSEMDIITKIILIKQ
jgi:hypothetical protein